MYIITVFGKWVRGNLEDISAARKHAISKLLREAGHKEVIDFLKRARAPEEVIEKVMFAAHVLDEVIEVNCHE